MSPARPQAPTASVVVATHNRPIELARCLEALNGQETRFAFEIVVVDDGSDPPVRHRDLSSSHERPLHLVRHHGSGPAGARNAGVARARGDVMLFTDDDTIPGSLWVESACQFLTRHPDHVGVEGPTTSPSYDPLYFHSAHASTPGSFLTCNVGYRRTAIEAVGGFSELFAFAREDLDLGFRIARLGPCGYVQDMAVLHPPMPATLAAEIQRGRHIVNDVRLFRRHPQRYPGVRYLSAPGYAVYVHSKHWVYSITRGYYNIGRSPTRALRFLILVIGYSAVGFLALMRCLFGRRDMDPS